MNPHLLQLLVVLALVALTAGLARRIGLLVPILLVVVGIVASYVPHFVQVRLDPDLILQGVLPLLLYIAAIKTPLPAFRKNLRPIGIMAFGHVLFIAAMVGLVLHALVPQLPLAVAFALGAIVGPPDAVAATSIAHRIGLPRRLVTVLEGESLVNDATALVTLRMAVAAATGAVVTWQDFGIHLAVSALGGLLIGGVVGRVVAVAHRRAIDPLVDNTVSILTPFLAFVPAERFGASGVVAVVACGIYIGDRRPTLMSAASRLQMDSFWRVTQFLLEGAVFLLVGLQIRVIAGGLQEQAGLVAVATVAVVGVVVVGRFVWVYPTMYLSRFLVPAARREPGTPGALGVISWAGMRGVVSLAAATGLPLDFPGRDLILWLTFVVILVTLIGQGLTLPAVVRWLRVPSDDPHADTLAEAAVRQQAFRAAARRLDTLTEGAEEPAEVVERLRALAQHRANHAWERLGDPEQETPSDAFVRLRQEMLVAERDVLRQARESDRIPSEVLRRVQNELDLEELLLARRNGEDEE